jgi:lipoyl-dependent peroxiredoxin
MSATTVRAPEKVIYTAEATSTGDGRNGHVRTSDGRVELDMAIPGPGGDTSRGTNPEQLFASGYAACFHSAIRFTARKAGIDPGESTMTASVDLGPEGDGFGLAVRLRIELPGVDRDKAQAVVDTAHQVCPYSRATRGNIPVELALA